MSSYLQRMLIIMWGKGKVRGMCFKCDTGSIVITVNGLLQISEWVKNFNVSAQNICNPLDELVLCYPGMSIQHLLTCCH